MRRLRENRLLPQPLPRLDVIREASLEVRGPVIYATPGRDRGVPAGDLHLQRAGPLRRTAGAGVHIRRARLAAGGDDRDAGAVRAAAARPRCAGRGALAAAAEGAGRAARCTASRRISRPWSRCSWSASLAAAAALPFLGGTFMPDFREGHFVIQVSSSIPGTSLASNAGCRAGASAPRSWRCPMSRASSSRWAAPSSGEDTWGPHRSEFHVELKADADVDQGAAQDALRGILAHYPGLQSEVVTFLGDRISESLSGETAQVAVKVFGDDLDALDATGDRIVAVLGKIPGIVDLQFKRQSGTPALAIQLRPGCAAGERAQGAGCARHDRDGLHRRHGRADFQRDAHRRCRGAAARCAAPSAGSNWGSS